MQDSITIGLLTFTWNGKGLTVASPGGEYDLDAEASRDLLIWIYDEQRYNIFAAHRAVAGLPALSEAGEEK